MLPMNNLMQKIKQMIDLQENILAEFSSITDVIITGEEQNIHKKPIQININEIEQIEKYYFAFSAVNDNMHKILAASKQQAYKLQQTSAEIRSRINKTHQIYNDNKFIDILNSQLNNNLIMGNTAIYESIQKSIELKDKSVDYTFIKSAKLIDNFYVNIPIANSLNCVQNMFYWFNGNKKYNKGIYLSLCKDFIVQVPFPDLIGKNSVNFKHKSMACKYKDITTCNARQIELSKKYNTEFRKCNFVHLGESFIKIGSDFRCPTLSSFGCHSTLITDIINVPLNDIKTILMNASSDLLLILLWYEHHKHLGEIIFTDLDKL